MEVQNDGRDAGIPTHRPKWEVYSDENGNMYFYNTVTGETTWELPENDAYEDDDGADHEPEDGGVELTATGETVVRNQLRDDVGNVLELTVVRPKYSQYQVAVEVIETMLQLLDDTQMHVEKQANSGKKAKRFASPAAEARAKKNEANTEKRRKRERLLAMTRYMNVLIPPVMTASAMESSVLGGKQPVGALFSKEDAKQWRLEKEVQQIRQRYKIRKYKVKHHEQVVSRAAHHHFLKGLRTDLLNYFIGQIPCSSELQQQRILLMTSPQQLVEMELQRKATLEPEMLERYEAEQRMERETSFKSLQKVFVLADHGGVGSLHLLQTLVTMFSDERAQKYALKVRGLAEIIQSAEIQRFVVDYVSNHQPQECKLSLSQFEEFVQTVEEVVDHYTSVKTAVEDAENEIAAAIEAAAAKGSGGAGSLLRARLNMVSKKKVEQELAALKATQQDLEAKIKREARVPYSDSGDDNLALMMAKEEWEKHHQHRYIRVEPWLPVYCCLCRRRKWELWRQELESVESEYRSTYANRYALKMKSEELRLIREENGGEVDATETHQEPVQPDIGSELPPSCVVHMTGTSIDTVPVDEAPEVTKLLDDDGIVVLQILRTLVLITERIHSEDAIKPPPARLEHRQNFARKQQQTGSPMKKKKKRKESKKAKNGEGGEDDEDELDELQLAMKAFETEDRERNLMRVEDTSMHIYLERNRRLVERPLLQLQDVAHNAYIRLLSHCASPSSLLNRLRFDRCLSFDPPQHLVLHVSDGASSDGGCVLPSRQLVLQTVPCRTESEANFVFFQVQQMQTKLKSPFVVDIASCAKHTYQFFAESGLLVECWPVVFVAVEYFPHGTWQEAFTQVIETQAVRDFAEAETVIIRVFRDVAAGLAAMHSSGILHLNANLGNFFIPEAPATIEEGEEGSLSGRLKHLLTIRLGGMLACKRSFDEGQLRRGDMTHCLNTATTPPEGASGQPMSGKADVWMVGCALWEALMIWQRHELRGRGHGKALPMPSTVIRLKTIPDLLQEIPLATSAAIRSLLRMLLQPNPSQRPQMSQVVDILSFASRKTNL